MPSVATLSFIILSVIYVSVRINPIMLNVILPRVIMPSVVAPIFLIARPILKLEPLKELTFCSSSPESEPINFFINNI
jgi:hypothetical protein